MITTDTTQSNSFCVSTYCDGEEYFERLVKNWQGEKGVTSSSSEIHSCPSYLRIIAMGEQAIPLILNALRREGDGIIGLQL